MTDCYKTKTYLIFADGSEEFERSLRYAALSARKNDAQIAILSVLGAQDFQHWGNVEDRMKAEQRAAAEAQLEKIVKTIRDLSGVKASTHILEGTKTEAVLQMVENNSDVTKLILSSSVRKVGQGPLLDYFTGKGVRELPIPLTIVPGHLTEEQIDKLI